MYTDLGRPGDTFAVASDRARPSNPVDDVIDLNVAGITLLMLLT